MSATRDNVSRRRILLVGVSRDISSVVASRFGANRVLAASSLDAVLDNLRRGDIGVVVVEHDLPGAIGTAVVASVRTTASAANTPIIYLAPSNAGHNLIATLISEQKVDEVLIHPIDQDELLRHISAQSGTALPTGDHDDQQARLSSAVSALWDKFREPNLARISSLERLTFALAEGDVEPDALRRAKRDAHKLAGSLGTFGFATASQIARRVEGLLGDAERLNEASVLHLTDLVHKLHDEVDAPPAPAATRSNRVPSQPLALVVTDGGTLSQKLVSEAEVRGIGTTTTSDLAAALVVAVEQRPDVIVLDLGLGEPGGALAFLAEIARKQPTIPVLVLTDRDSFVDRVEVANLGGRGFLAKSLPPAQVLEMMNREIEHNRATEGIVLAVDDDPQVLAALGELLEPRGLHVVTVDNPLDFWDALEDTSPDLLILDVDMPHLSGIELCRVVRNEPRWGGLPIIFLTAHVDKETVIRVFSAGADDYVNKPIVGPELITRITNRLERARLYRSLAEIDPLTGVANRRKSIDVLGQFLQLASRQGQQVSFAILDVDHFKEVNDRFGHLAGDEVLRRLAGLLGRSFRSEDIVSRWGGEEFVVGMYGMPRESGVKRMADALEAFRQERIATQKGEVFTATFSGGVAQFPDDGSDVASLYRAADAALYLAKKHGRNRVLPSGWQPKEVDDSHDVDVVVIDDDELLRGLLQYALGSRGYQTRCFADGRSAVDALTGPTPSLSTRLILLDVDLPDVDGFTVLKRLTDERVTRETKVIMLTAQADEKEVVRAFESGAVDHVAKPFSLPVLVQRIRRTLEMAEAGRSHRT